MEFKKTNPDENYQEKWISDCGKIELGFHRVMYGWRLRAGFIGDQWVELDWCCGDKFEHRIKLLAHLFNILKDRDHTNAFDRLPGHSQIKPFVLDQNFMDKIRFKL